MSKKKINTKPEIPLPRYRNNDTIQEFVKAKPSYKNSLKTLHSILIKEGDKKELFFNKELSLDLDDVERRMGHGQQDNSVDCVLGCLNNILLMVEIKLRVNDANNLSKKKLLRKINHSRNLLICNSFKIHGLTIVLLKENKFEQNKNKVFRLLDNQSNIVEPMTVGLLYQKIFT